MNPVQHSVSNQTVSGTSSLNFDWEADGIILVNNDHNANLALPTKSAVLSRSGEYSRKVNDYNKHVAKVARDTGLRGADLFRYAGATYKKK